MRGNSVLHFVLSFIFVLPVFALRDGCRDDAIFPDEEDEKQGQSSGSPPVSTPPPLSDDPPEGANSSGVPIYVVVIVCVTSVLLTAAMYTTVLLIGWTKAKCQSRTLTNAEADGDYETTTRDVNMGENAYCSLTPVQAAYVNININNQPRPSTSTSAASPESPESNTNMYYSVVADTVV
ncbi:uncharacterized protein [Haliotis cracherodii]|uniref:uncharacterized protein isoform X2 n=1 Tax=Haliotis cracherodii TaxID=6455 RepID=UPI0039E9F7C7